MTKKFLEVQGLGRCELVQECGPELIVQDESGVRSRVPYAQCIGYITDEAGQVIGAVIPPPEDNPAADQFTGADMGAEMAAAEGGHTPGPWSSTVDQSDAETGVPTAFIIQDSKGGLIAVTGEADVGREVENCANAFLIAAAPDLLAALRFHIRSGLFSGEYAADMIALFDKAEGRA